MKPEYRIKELCNGEFVVEVKGVETRTEPSFFWKKPKETVKTVWWATNDIGDSMLPYYEGNRHKTLAAARKAAKRFMEGEKIHEVE